MIILTLPNYEKHFEMNEETFEELIRHLFYSLQTRHYSSIPNILHSLPHDLSRRITTRKEFVGSPDQFGYPHIVSTLHVEKREKLEATQKAGFGAAEVKMMLFEQIETRRQYQEAVSGLRLYWKYVNFTELPNDERGTILFGLEAELHRQMPDGGFCSQDGTWYKWEQIRKGARLPELEK